MLRFPSTLFAAFLFACTFIVAKADPPTGEESLASTASIIDTTGVTFDRNASVDQLLESAREMFISDNYALSEMLYKSVLIREPNNLSAMLELAVIYEAQGKLQYARGLLTRALIISPHDDDIIERNNRVVRTLAKSVEDEVNDLMRRKAYELALPKLSVLLTTRPENAELHYKKATCHLELGHPEAAIAEIEKALRLEREDPRFSDLKDRAEEAIAQRDIDKLMLQARAALRRDTRKGEGDALELIGQILELDPDHGWANAQFMNLTEKRGGTTKSALRRRFEGIGTPVIEAFQPVGAWFVDLSAGFREDVEMLMFVLLALLLLNSPFTHMLVRGFSPRQSLSGRLRDFSIKEVLSLINTHHLTGALRIKTGKRKGYIYFKKGEIYHCRSGRMIGREALQRLIRSSLGGYFVFKEGRRVSDATVETPLSLILLELPERKDENTAKNVLKKQTRIRSLLGSDKR